MGIELDLNSVSGSEFTLLWGVEKYLVFVAGSKLSGFCVEASNLTWFYGGDQIGLISVASKLG